MAEPVIAFPLMQRIRNDATALQRVFITLASDGRSFGELRSQIYELVQHALDENPERSEQSIISSGVDPEPHVTARLQGQIIRRLVQLDQARFRDTNPVIVEVRTDLSDVRLPAKGWRCDPVGLLTTCFPQRTTLLSADVEPKTATAYLLQQFQLPAFHPGAGGQQL